jgi:formate dehydrogenase
MFSSISSVASQCFVSYQALITTPFHPAYMTPERLKKAKKLKLILTGVGSDHINLHMAAEKGMMVAEVSGSIVVLVAEDELMRILVMVRNFLPTQKQISEGWFNFRRELRL